MAQFHCPVCGVPLTKGEYDSGVCPVCDAPTRAGYDRGERRSAAELPASEYAPGWHSVQSGVGLIYYGALVIFIAIAISVLLFGVAVLASFGRPRGFGDGIFEGLFALNCLLGLAAIICGLLTLIGQALCCAAPPNTQSRSLAIGSLLCTGLALFFTCLGSAAVSQFGRAPRGSDILAAGPCLGAASGLVLLLGFGFFVMFLRSAAVFFKNRWLARNCAGFLVVSVLIVFLAGVFAANAVTQQQGFGNRLFPRNLLLIASVVGGILFLVQLFWYLILLRKTRKVIRNALLDRPPVQYSDDYLD